MFRVSIGSISVAVACVSSVPLGTPSPFFRDLPYAPCLYVRNGNALDAISGARARTRTGAGARAGTRAGTRAGASNIVILSMGQGKVVERMPGGGWGSGVGEWEWLVREGGGMGAVGGTLGSTLGSTLGVLWYVFLII